MSEGFNIYRFVGGLSVVIGRSGIFPSGLPVVASFTQWTPVAPVPEQLSVTTDHVVKRRGIHVPAGFLTLLAQGMRLE